MEIRSENQYRGVGVVKLRLKLTSAKFEVEIEAELGNNMYMDSGCL